MAKDDYHVIVYQILAYLYQCLKKGIPVNGRNLSYQKSKFFDINKNYWSYIIVKMCTAGWIEGIILTKAGEKNIRLFPIWMIAVLFLPASSIYAIILLWKR